MGRRYTKEEYLELYEKIKKRIPDAAITTDIIVGFPGETAEDFEETLDVVRKCKFDNAFTFIFSKRVGTPAEKLEDPITKEEKEERLKKLNVLVNDYSLEANRKYLGKTVDVLITGPGEKGENIVCGYTETMKLVNITGGSDLIGTIAKVKIKEAKSFSLDGVIEK